jgi:hypothetical protein
MDSKVIVKVLSITKKTSDIVEVCLSLAEKPQQFFFTLESDETDPEFISIAEEPRFAQFFIFNVPIASQILKLITKVINGEVVNFPLNLGCFYSREEALAQQKLFYRELIQR